MGKGGHHMRHLLDRARPLAIDKPIPHLLLVVLVAPRGVLHRAVADVGERLLALAHCVGCGVLWKEKRPTPHLRNAMNLP